MIKLKNITYADLDWNQLWQNARRKKGWDSKGPKEWDKKSSSFAKRNNRSAYIDLVLKNLPLKPDYTVLDIGSGPGTLALPIAKQCKSVTAIDFSKGMLDILASEAEKLSIPNIQTVECSWEDDWNSKGIIPHSVTLASRSMGVDNITEAIQKINDFATHYVCITDRISPTPFDPDLFKALGRTFQSGPDYIYTLNILYQMGIHPNVVILELEKELYFENIDQAVQSYSWMIKNITSDEENLLKTFIEKRAQRDKNGDFYIIRNPVPKWALIWWKKVTLITENT